MPFTFSHPAVVLPLALIDKRRFSVTALTIGSITPDFEYFINFKQHSIYSHTWLGIFWFDIPLSIVLFILFNWLVKEELIDNLPPFLNRRFSRFKNLKRIKYTGQKYLIVFTSLFIGIVSHLFWDKFTHKSVSLIEEPMDFYPIVWDASSVIGAIAISIFIWRMPKRPYELKNDHFRYWAVLLLVVLFVTVTRAVFNTEIRDLGVSTISGIFIGLLITSAINKKNSTQSTNNIITASS